MRKLIYVFFFLLSLILCASCASCDSLLNSNSKEIKSIEKIESIGLIDKYVINYTDGTKYEFEIKNGQDGQNGANGNNGENGKSAYELARENGYSGTLEQWLEALVGQKGENGLPGANGKSAYELAVENGYTGTLEEWLESLIGVAGEPGENGKNGTNGKSAYELACENGFKGSLEDWLLSLVGQKGDNGENGQPGADGKSAYEIALENGFDGTEEDWLASLKGQDSLSIQHQFEFYYTLYEATEVSHGIDVYKCTECDQVIFIHVEKLPHEHQWDFETWLYDDNTHWNGTLCGHDAKTNEASHSYDEWLITKQPTELEQGEKERSCVICGYKQTQKIEKLPHVHTFSDNWSYDETNHWHDSTCGHIVVDDEGTHTYGSWSITQEATGTSDGLKERVCSKCGYKQEEIIGHYLNLELNDEGSGYIVTGINNLNLTKIEVPSDYNDKPILKISKGAFKNCNLVKTISIPFAGEMEYSKSDKSFSFGIIFGEQSYTGSTGISQSEFTGYKSGSIQTITHTYYIPNTLKTIIITNAQYIQRYAFNNLAVENIILKEATIEIGEYAFYFSKAVNITLSNNITYIGNSAFNACKELKTINIPSNLLEIGQNTFNGCSKIQNLVFPECFTYVGQSSFLNMTELRTLVLPYAQIKQTGSSDTIIGSAQNLEYVIGSFDIRSYEFYNSNADYKYYYLGTKNYSTNSHVYVYSDSKPEEAGRYWHYNNGMPVIWD